MGVIPYTPEVYFTQHAFGVSVREAERYYQKGMSREGKPWETAMYPLAHLVLKPGVYKCPLELVRLGDIERVVVVRVVIPPDRFKQHGHGHARHGSSSLSYGEITDLFRPYYQRHIAEFPLLGAFMKQHSHHRLGLAAPSVGDMQHNIMNATAWYRRQGLNTMFSMIMTRSRAGEWTIHGNALWRVAMVNVPTGAAKVVSNNHRFAREAREQPYYRTRAGAEWCDKQKRKLKESRFVVSRNYLLRGWRRYVVCYKPCSVVIAIPPAFPSDPVKAFRIVDIRRNEFESLAVPEWARGSRYEDIDLVALARYLEEEVNMHEGAHGVPQ